MSTANARLEGDNTKLKLLTRLAYGFHSHKPLIALAMMKLGGLCPPLPRPRLTHFHGRIAQTSSSIGHCPWKS